MLRAVQDSQGRLVRASQAFGYHDLLSTCLSAIRTSFTKFALFDLEDLWNFHQGPVVVVVSIFQVLFEPFYADLSILCQYIFFSTRAQLLLLSVGETWSPLRWWFLFESCRWAFFVLCFWPYANILCFLRWSPGELIVCSSPILTRDRLRSQSTTDDHLSQFSWVSIVKETKVLQIIRWQ